MSDLSDHARRRKVREATFRLAVGCFVLAVLSILGAALAVWEAL